MRLISIVASLGLALLLLSCASQPDAVGFVQELTQVESLQNNDYSTPPGEDAAWKATALSDNWDVTRPDYGGGVWYRVPVVLQGDSTRQLGVLLSSFSMNASIWWDGLQLASGGQMSEPVARNWHRPLYASIPDAWAWSGWHWMHIFVRGYANDSAGLGAVLIGEERVILPRYEHVFFVQYTLSIVALFATILLGAGALLLWLLRKEQRAFLWIAVASLFWAVAISNFVVRDPPMMRFFWGVLCQSAVDFYAFSLLMMVHAIFGLQRRGVEWLFAFLLVGGWLLVALFGGDGDITVWGMPMHSVALALSFYPLWVCMVEWQRQHNHATLIVGVAIVMQLAVASHDWWAVYVGNQLDHLLLMQFGPTVALLIVGIWMSFRFAESLQAAESYTHQIEDEVARVTDQLHQEQEAKLQLAQQRAVHEERERFVRELHDGIGGHLAALSSMANDGLQDSSLFAETIDQALVDMRVVMDGFGDECDDVGLVLGMLRHRLARRLQSQGLKVTWDLISLPMPCPLHAGGGLHLLRIIQEALTNVVRHADASSVEVRASMVRDNGKSWVLVEVVDDGCGFVLHDKGGGSGLANMQKRVQILGGILEVQSDNMVGTRVQLIIPE